MILRRIFQGMGILTVGFFCFFAWQFMCSVLFKPTYDAGDPHFSQYSRLLDRMRSTLDERAPTAEDIIDLADLNGGLWRSACLFGGYGNPSKTLDSLHARITPEDRRRLAKLGSEGFRIAEVEEFEAMIAYVDHDGAAHFIHFGNGLGAGGQHFERCVTQPETKIRLG
jgi:hypothetical protein